MTNEAAGSAGSDTYSDNASEKNGSTVAGNRDLARSRIASHPVKKAYEQVADQIRAYILSGEISPDERLPNEAGLAEQFAVSRPTIREALRVLDAENLIRTSKGAHGGSFVTVPSVAAISATLGTNINLLSQGENVTLEEFLELRGFLEVPAAQLAAERHTDAALESLRRSIPDNPMTLGIERQFARNRDFHSELVKATGNTLLVIAAEPIFSVLQTHLQRSTLGEDFHRCINDDHRAILAALESGDPEDAGKQMDKHLAHLRPMYERAWRFSRRPKDGE